MKEQTLKIISNEKITDNVFVLKLQAEKGLEIKAGQFVNISVNDNALLLKRPFCVFDYTSKSGATAAGGVLTVCYQVKGAGTNALSTMKDFAKVTYPLGNGFEVKPEYKNIILIGGGIGVFPFYLLKNYKDVKFTAYFGFKNKENSYFIDEFKSFCDLKISTEDGSLGEKGFVTDLVRKDLFGAPGSSRPTYDAVFVCGNKAMLGEVKKLGLKNAYVSVEERMGCGVGACLTCACKLNVNGEQYNMRVCKDGPVFDLQHVVL